MKRLICLGLIMVFMLGGVQTMSFSSYSNEKSWTEYYLDTITGDDFFTDEMIRQQADYFLFDADNNGTPELVVCTNDKVLGEILYSVTETGLNAIELPFLNPLEGEEMLSIGCVQEEGTILVSGYLEQGYIQQYLITATQETMQIEVLGSILDNDALSKYGNGTDHFLWNGKALSLDEYADRMTALFDESKELLLSVSGPFYYDYEDLMAYLQNQTDMLKTDLTSPHHPDGVTSEFFTSEISADQLYQKALILFEKETEESDREAFELFIKAAEAGDPRAMGKLATIYRMGFGVEANDKEAFYWAKMGAAYDDPWSLWNMGFCYLNGIGTAINYEEAYRLFVKASEMEDREVCGYAYNDIGYMYENGLYVNQNAATAVSWFKKGASLDNPYAMFNLSNCYLDGFGIDQSFDQALTWMEKAAAQGDEYEAGLGIAQHIWLVGNMLYNDIDYSSYRSTETYKADKRIGQMWIETAAKLGNKQALAFLETEKDNAGENPAQSEDGTNMITDPENCWTPALVSEGRYEYYQSSVQTYQSITGGLCIASVDENDNLLEGYRPMSDHYGYRYEPQRLEQYIAYLRNEGFDLMYQTTQEETDVYVYCNEEKGFALSVYVYTEQGYVWIEPRVGWEELTFWTGKEYADRNENVFGTPIRHDNMIELQYREARYNTGWWNVPVLQPVSPINNCTEFTLCFEYTEVDEEELGEHRVYVSLNEYNSAWLECEPLNVDTKGEVYRLNVSFDKPRTVGGVAVLPKQATEKNFSVIAWIEDPVFAE